MATTTGPVQTCTRRLGWHSPTQAADAVQLVQLVMETLLLHCQAVFVTVDRPLWQSNFNLMLRPIHREL